MRFTHKSLLIGVVSHSVLLSPAANLPCHANATSTALVKHANQLCSLKRYKASAEELRRAIAADPKDYDARVALATVLTTMGDKDGALEHATAAIKLRPERVEGYKCRADIYFKKKQPQMVIDDATKAIKLDPKDPHLYLLRASGYFFLTEFAKDNADDSKRSQADLDMALKLNPKSAQAHYYRGCWYVMQKNLPQAIACFTKANELDPKDSAPLRYRSMAYSATKEYAKAAKDLDRVIELNPKSAEGWQARAGNYELMGEYQKAFDDYTQSLKLASKKFRTRYSRAAVAVKLKRFRDAIADYDAILAANALDDEALKLRGDCFVKLNEYSKALADYNEAIDLSPEAASYYEARSRVHSLLRNAGAAKKDTEKAKTLRSRPAELKI